MSFELIGVGLRVSVALALPVCRGSVHKASAKQEELCFNTRVWSVPHHSFFLIS